MCLTMVTPATESPSSSGDDSSYEWRQEAINGGSLRLVDLETGSNGWASPPGDLFALRGSHYFSHNQKSPSGDWLLLPAGVDWLRSPHRLDNFLSHPNNSIAASLRRAQSLKPFIIAVNLQIPSREHHSAVFYFAADNPIPAGSVLHQFIHGDDAFRNSRFKMVNRIVKGPWIFKAAMGNYGACMLGKGLTCNYHKGENYLEIDVDIGSSAVASAVLKLTMGYVAAVTIDMGFLVEAQSEEELPEKLIGAVRIAQMEISAAKYVEPVKGNEKGR